MKENLKIAFCDDEQNILEELKGIVDRYIKENKLQAEYFTFNKGEELLDSSACPDILFLDIDMPGKSGIETGAEFRKKHKDCRIIMATAIDHIPKDVFQIHPFRYATKPFRKEEICRYMGQVLETFIGGNLIAIYSNRRERKVREDQILYFKAEFGYVSVKVAGEDKLYRRTDSLSKIIKNVDSRLFSSPSRQYLVNLAYVTRIDDESIVLEEEEIPLSRRKKEEFIEKFQKYDIYYRG